MVATVLQRAAGARGTRGKPTLASIRLGSCGVELLYGSVPLGAKLFGFSVSYATRRHLLLPISGIVGWEAERGIE